MEEVSVISQRDFLLVPFPFSDQSGRKVRPVIVVSNDLFNSHSSDLIVVGVTSNVKKERYSLSLENKDLEEGKLISSCIIKTDNILKLEKDLIIKRIGKIKESKLDEVLSLLNDLLSKK